MQLDIPQILRVLATYVTIQTVAQDLGIETGKSQSDLIKSPVVQAVLLYATAYTAIKNYYIALVVVMIYYSLKYIYSDPIYCFDVATAPKGSQGGRT